MLRISTMGSHEFQLAQNLRTQTRMNEIQLEIASGFKAQAYSETAEDASRLLNMESAISTTNSYQRNVDTIERRLNLMEASVARLFEIATNLRTNLIQGTNANNADEMDLTSLASGMLQEAANLLNVDDEGRFLFAGGRTDVQPVDITGFDSTNPGYNPADPSTANFGYYAGDDQILTGRIDNNLALDYGIPANESGFENLMRALDITIRAGVPGASDQDQLNVALDMVNQAITEIPNIRTRIGTDLITLENTDKKHENLQLFTEEFITNIEATDVPEAMARLGFAEVQLEASYSVTARLSQITLVNFIR